MNDTQDLRDILNILSGIKVGTESAISGVDEGKAMENYPDYAGQVSLSYSIKDISEKAGPYGIRITGERPEHKIIERIKDSAKILYAGAHKEREGFLELSKAYIHILDIIAGDFESRKTQLRSEQTEDGFYKEALKLVNLTENILSQFKYGKLVTGEKDILAALEHGEIIGDIKKGLNRRALMSNLTEGPYKDHSVFHKYQTEGTKFLAVDFLQKS